MADYIPNSDTIFQDWLGNFISVANANLVALGLIAGDISPLSTDKTTFDMAITDLEAKKAIMKAATQAKDTVRESAEQKARALVKRIQAKADVTNALKAQLQITVPGSGSATPPVPYVPMNLVANTVGSGSYELTWKRNGNTNSINFIIEALFAGSSAFVQIFSTTKTSHIHSGNAPGAKISYRVKAQHGDIFSPYSNIAVVNESTVIPASV
jgi:hypothetical protein